MSKKDENQFEEEVKNNIDETEKNVEQDADTVETQGDDADVKENSSAEAEESSDASDAKEAEETVDIEEEKSSKKDQKDAVIEELQDRLKRQMAEFDNYRKRTEKEKSSMFEMGASDVVKKLLPIVDNFERGFKSVTDEELETPFAKGMDMVYKQTIKMLEELQVKPIEAVGLEFNPDLHNAVMHVEDDSVGENIVVEEFEKGYTYRETVIRHSMVKVAN
ncbi:MAG: nucleotide exchange factor GrpE [Eubacteriales bacterium]|nr:nucleotide exchange factor GrpE [Eubacteriales bacterium]